VVRDAYRLTVAHWKIPPSEFWGMTLEEFWWLQADSLEQARKTSGAMTKAELDELDAWFEDNKVKYGRNR